MLTQVFHLNMAQSAKPHALFVHNNMEFVLNWLDKVNYDAIK